jgi:iron complex outermembrane receptor protein
MKSTLHRGPRALCLKKLALLVAVCTAQQAFAQESSATREAPELEEVLVEGRPVREGVSQLAIDVARFGTQVQTISSEEIDTGGFTNFGELAAGLIRGANIGYSPDEGEFTIRIDGGTDRDTLLLLDGVPTFDRGTPLESLWGATALDPRMIENVEIFRGGQSLYFGGNGGLGVVNAIYKRPEMGDDVHGEVGVYAGDFKTREMYGNVTTPLFGTGNHYLMVFGRSYETDAHEIFSEEAYVDNVLALGGKHDFPYSYNSIGFKYLWAIDEDTEFRLGYQWNTINFEDSFPNYTIYTPNFTDFPMLEARFNTAIGDRFTYEAEGYFTDPRLKNSEVVARVCGIPRMADLPADIQTLARNQGITAFRTAAQFETFAATVPGLPAGCVTSPYSIVGASNATINSRSGIYVNAQGVPYGTVANPFPIGAPIGYAIESISQGLRAPVKGFGDPDQATAGYIDMGFNNRLKWQINNNFEAVAGFQNITYKDNSDDVYGMLDESVRSNGLYGELRMTTDNAYPTNISLASRHDFNSAYEDESIWKYGVRQSLPRGFYARSNGGTSYSQPTLTEAGFIVGRVVNPNLETQQVETYSYGFGVDGDIMGGTFNVEIGYFDTEINNQFGTANLRNVCINYPGVRPQDINPNIIIPTEFCEFALANGLADTSTASFNLRRAQDISGATLDIAFDFDQWQMDFTFTDMESLEPNPIYNQRALLNGTGAVQTFNVPGEAGTDEFRQSGERAEWSASMLLTYTPTDRWVFAMNAKWQGPEWNWAPTGAARLVNTSGQRVVQDEDFGNYMVVNGSIQYFMGMDLQHRFLLRVVNMLDEDYFERGGFGNQAYSRAGARGELTQNDANYYYSYGWNGKPRSFWVQYEYNF